MQWSSCSAAGGGGRVRRVQREERLLLWDCLPEEEEQTQCHESSKLSLDLCVTLEEGGGSLLAGARGHVRGEEAVGEEEREKETGKQRNEDRERGTEIH